MQRSLYQELETKMSMLAIASQDLRSYNTALLEVMDSVLNHRAENLDGCHAQIQLYSQKIEKSAATITKLTAKIDVLRSLLSDQ